MGTSTMSALCKLAQISKWCLYGSEQLREQLGLHPRHLPVAETDSRKETAEFPAGFDWRLSVLGKNMCKREHGVFSSKKFGFLDSVSAVDESKHFSLDGEKKLF